MRKSKQAIIRLPDVRDDDKFAKDSSPILEPVHPPLDLRLSSPSGSGSLDVVSDSASRSQEREPQWAWSSTSEVMATSNVAHFIKGPFEVGARLGYSGQYQQDVPSFMGYFQGHLEQQTLRFPDARYDYGTFLASGVLSHSLLSKLQFYEGSSFRFSLANASPENQSIETSLFTGLGAFGETPTGGTWFGTVTLERNTAQMLRDSHYAQSVRLGCRQTVGHDMGLEIQGTIQRIDPIIRSTAYLQYFGYCSFEIPLNPHLSMGMRGLAGVQRTTETSAWFAEAGPFLQAHF